MVYKALKNWQLEFIWNNIFSKFIIDKKLIGWKLIKK